MVESAARFKRLLVYLDVPYRSDGDGFSTDRAFLKFVIGLRSRSDCLVLVGRVRDGRSDYPIPPDVEVVGLPDYPTLRHVGSVLAVAPQALKLLWREVGKSDAVISIGPHPLSLPTALFALLRRRRLTLMVRQNYPEYIRHRLPSPRWRPFVTVASAADNLFRVLSRGTPTVVVGDELAHRYRAAPRLLNLSVSLMPAEVHGSHRGSGDADAPRLLSITRLDPEKSPHLLIEALALLNALQPERRARLTIAGVGELRPDIERLAEERVPGQVTFAGYVPHGEDLFELYRSHDLLVHTAKTEGVPQVVVEAQFVGLPVVATDVGGVRGAVGGGASALLVPVGDPKAIADSVISLLDDSVLRDHVVQAGLIATKRLTLQAQVDRLASFAAQPE